METASYFAKKHGLEHYLDKPRELNEMILKLLVLQETMQDEAMRARRRSASSGEIISVGRTVTGRFTAACDGDRTYQYAVETALRASTAPVPIFQWGRFEGLLEKMGVPGDRIAEYVGTVMLSDDTHCIDRD
ncbi:MAG: hypothetical protein OEW15_17895 [Nitrospirota bacterium]|nr:hypothetical protein [Nitrospirota bacterium]